MAHHAKPSKCRVACSLSMRISEFEEIALREAEVSMRPTKRTAEEEVARFRICLRGYVEPRDFFLIEFRQAFHFNDACRGPIFGGSFRQDRDFLLDLCLDKAHSALLYSKHLDVSTIAEILQQAPIDTPLRSCQNYYLLSATQQSSHANVRIGLKTSWT